MKASKGVHHHKQGEDGIPVFTAGGNPHLRAHLEIRTLKLNLFRRLIEFRAYWLVLFFYGTRSNPR
jgi:hypothetical protein